MDIHSKKIDLAEKMYCQNGYGAKGPSPKYTEHGKNSGKAGGESVTLHGKTTGKGGGEAAHLADAKGGFKAKYHQAKAKVASAMIEGHSKASQKGKASLESIKNGKTMRLAGNEHNRA